MLRSKLPLAVLDRPFAKQVCYIVHLVVKHTQLLQDALDLRLGASIDVEIELSAQAIPGVLAVLAHHNDGSLHGGEHGKEEIEQNKWIGIPGLSIEEDIERCEIGRAS